MEPLNITPLKQSLCSAGGGKSQLQAPAETGMPAEMFQQGTEPPGTGLIPKIASTSARDTGTAALPGIAAQTAIASAGTAVSGSIGTALATALKQIFDLKGSAKYKNFRTMHDPVKIRENKPTPSTEGLAELRASGSSEFTRAGLEEIKARIGEKKIVVFDLREESHGYFDEKPVSWRDDRNWANQGMTVEEVSREEKGLLEGAKEGDSTIQAAPTEEQICAEGGAGYVRIPVTDQSRPEDRDVDQFLSTVKNLDPGSWLHFHCKAGQGRTTTFLAMYDMMHNAKKVSLEDIVLRQDRLGGFNLFFLRNPATWEGQEDRKRVAFIKDFYLYCSTNADDYKTTWAQWVSSNR